MNFSDFGQKFTSKSGIVSLMEDLGNALSINNEIQMLGGGNPGNIEEVQNYFKDIINDELSNHQNIGETTSNVN